MHRAAEDDVAGDRHVDRVARRRAVERQRLPRGELGDDLAETVAQRRVPAEPELPLERVGRRVAPPGQGVEVADRQRLHAEVDRAERRERDAVRVLLQAAHERLVVVAAGGRRDQPLDARHGHRAGGAEVEPLDRAGRGAADLRPVGEAAAQDAGQLGGLEVAERQPPVGHRRQVLGHPLPGIPDRPGHRADGHARGILIAGPVQDGAVGQPLAEEVPQRPRGGGGGIVRVG